MRKLEIQRIIEEKIQFKYNLCIFSHPASFQCLCVDTAALFRRTIGNENLNEMDNFFSLTVF